MQKSSVINIETVTETPAANVIFIISDEFSGLWEVN
jgi:hypothetical protein